MSTETQTTSATVDCSVDSTISTSFGSCSSGAKTSTISITNNESSTAYYLVEYQIDSGSFTTAATNLSIASSTDTSLTASVPHGSTITWRIKDSLTSNNFSGVSYETQSTSSVVDCPVIDASASQALEGCSAGAQVSTITLANSNSANSTAYFLVEYSVDGVQTGHRKQQINLLLKTILKH